jgi:hypothetical protein
MTIIRKAAVKWPKGDLNSSKLEARFPSSKVRMADLRKASGGDIDTDCGHLLLSFKEPKSADVSTRGFPQFVYSRSRGELVGFKER